MNLLVPRQQTESDRPLPSPGQAEPSAPIDENANQPVEEITFSLPVVTNLPDQHEANHPAVPTEISEDEQIQIAPAANEAAPNISESTGPTDAPQPDQQNQVESDELVAWANYQKEVLARIYEQIRYPESALMRGQEDMVRLNLRIDQQDQVIDVALLEESRYNSLNIEARRAAERTAPLSHPPGLQTEKQLELLIPVNFRLTQN